MSQVITQDAVVIKNFAVNLDLKKSVSNTDFEVVEGDTENYVAITLTDEGEAVELTGCRVLAVFSHSGGSSIQDSANISGGVNIEGNVINIHLKNGSFKRGIVECELRISGGSALSISTTPTFNFSCRPPLISDSSVMSDDKITVFTELLQQTQNALSAASSAVHAADQLSRIYIVYSDTDPRLSDDVELSTTTGRYMGVYCGSSRLRPLNASQYTWHDTVASSIVSATVSDNNMVFTMSDQSNISVSLAQCLGTKQEKSLYFKNITVPASDFASDDTYPDYPYMAEIVCDGVNSQMICYVNFSPIEAVSGNFAPICESKSGKVVIYAKELPENTVNILWIKAEVAQ